MATYPDIRGRKSPMFLDTKGTMSLFADQQPLYAREGDNVGFWDPAMTGQNELERVGV